MTKLHLPKCWICGGAVSFGDSQVDEKGLAVHESCYVSKKKREVEGARPSASVLKTSSNEESSRRSA